MSSKKVYLNKSQVRAIVRHHTKPHARKANPSPVQHGIQNHSTAWWTSYRNREKER